MLEEKRRQEILMAEEAIRLLGKEMARASGMADQAEVASEKLEKANAAVNLAIEDLQKMVATQEIITNQSQEFFGQAKTSLDVALKTLSDAEEHINKIDANIIGAINEIREASKIIQTSSSKLSSDLIREQTQANLKNKERHNELLLILKDNSKELHLITETVNDNNDKLIESLSTGFSEGEKKANLRYNAAVQIAQDNSNKLLKIAQSIRDSDNKLSSSLANGFSEAEKQADIRQRASIQILQSNTETMQSTIKAIEDSDNKLSSSLANGFSEAEKQADIRHKASSKIFGDNLKKLNDISENQLSNILSVLRFASAAAIIGAAASVIVLVLNLI